MPSPISLARAVGGVFRPETIPTQVYYINPDDIGPGDMGSAPDIAQITERLNGLVFSNATESQRPHLNTTDRPGHQVADLTLSGAMSLRCVAPTQAALFTGNCYFWIFAKVINWSAYPIMTVYNSSVPAVGHRFGPMTSPAWRYQRQQADPLISTGSQVNTINDSDWHLWSMTWDNSTGTWEFFRDGVSQGTDVDAPSSPAGLTTFSYGALPGVGINDVYLGPAGGGLNVPNAGLWAALYSWGVAEGWLD